jgi:hypothetical protein
MGHTPKLFPSNYHQVCHARGRPFFSLYSEFAVVSDQACRLSAWTSAIYFPSLPQTAEQMFPRRIRNQLSLRVQLPYILQQQRQSSLTRGPRNNLGRWGSGRCRLLGPKAPTLYGALATLASHLSLGEVLQPDLLDQYNHHDPSLSYRAYATKTSSAETA